MFGKSRTMPGVAVAALPAIDVTEARRRLAENEAARTKIGDAIEAAEVQKRELVKQRADGHVDGGRVADALLAGETITAAETADAISERIATIDFGIVELSTRSRALAEEGRTIREEVARSLAQAAKPAAEIVAERAKAAVAELLQAQADAKAIVAASESAAAQRVALAVDAVKSMAAELEIMGIRDIAPSPEIVALFAPAADAIRVARLRMPG